MESLIVELFSTLDHLAQLYRIFDPSISARWKESRIDSGKLSDYLTGKEDPFSNAFTEEYQRLASLRDLRNDLVHRKVPWLTENQRRGLENDLENHVSDVCDLISEVFCGIVESFQTSRE